MGGGVAPEAELGWGASNLIIGPPPANQQWPSSQCQENTSPSPWDHPESPENPLGWSGADLFRLMLCWAFGAEKGHSS